MEQSKYVKRTVALCFLMIMVTLGLCSSGRTMYLTAITEALNIPRGAFSIGATFRYVTTALMNLYFGHMVARFGTKKLVIAGFISLIIFAVLNIVATTLVVFYIANIFLGIGLSFAATTMAGTIINRTCTENKGTVTGLVLSANGIGGAIAAQVISPIIFQEGNPFGYRDSYILVTCVLVVVMVFIIAFYREPEKGSLKDMPIGKKKKKRGSGWIGMDFSETRKKAYFYVAVLCVFLTGATARGVGDIALPHMYDVGIKMEYVAILTSISSIVLTFAKFGNGITFDKCGIKVAMNICYTSQILSVVILGFISNTSAGRALAFSRSVLSPVAMPLETVMLPLFASELFGDKSFEKALGIFAAANYAGQALGAPLGNIFYDILGNYNLSFVVYSMVSVFIMVAMQFVLFAANRDKKEILAIEADLIK